MYNYTRIHNFHFSGQGFKTAPVVGKLLMELATNQPTSYDVEPYALTRFKSVPSSRL